MIHVAIVEDEEKYREQLVDFLSRYSREREIAIQSRCYCDGIDVLDEYAKQFQVILLDIRMKHIDGMETARIVRRNNKDMILIFVTAVEEYVFQAFDVGAFHYLVKPFSDDKFEEVVKRAIKTIGENSSNENDDKYMMIQSAGSHIKVFLRDIVYAEVFNRKVIIHTRNADIEYYGKLRDLCDIAGADFFRTHRAYLVHFKYVVKYDANCVTLENGIAMIAKQNYPEFVKQYLKYNQRKGSRIG